MVSIGNLSFGGTGKTPTVIALCQALAARGIKVCVLTRGYRRSHAQPTEIVPHDGDPRRYGDEPVLIAKHAGVPVVVDAQRARAARWAHARLSPQLFVLDDGFSHLKLERDLDVVLLAEHDLRAIARRRELRRALDDADLVCTLEPSLRAPRILPITRRIATFMSAGGPVDLVGKRVAALCAIAHPERFVRDLEAAGLRVASRRFFHDHHPLPEGAIADALATGVEAVVITEKDAVKLPALPERVYVAVSEVVLPDALVAAAAALVTPELMEEAG